MQSPVSAAMSTESSTDGIHDVTFTVVLEAAQLSLVLPVCQMLLCRLLVTASTILYSFHKFIYFLRELVEVRSSLTLKAM